MKVRILTNNIYIGGSQWDRYIGKTFEATKKVCSMDEDDDPWYYAVKIPEFPTTVRFEQNEVEIIEE